jgi:hypothetical protein
MAASDRADTRSPWPRVSYPEIWLAIPGIDVVPENPKILRMAAPRPNALASPICH